MVTFKCILVRCWNLGHRHFMLKQIPTAVIEL